MRKPIEEFIEEHKGKIEKGIKDPNRKDIMRFYKFVENQGYGTSYRIQILRYLYQLNSVLKGKPFKKVSQDDMVGYMEQLRKPRTMCMGTKKYVSPYSANTMRSIIGIVKLFFKWLYEMESGYPPCVNWIKNEGDPGKITEDDIITVEELKKLVEVCRNDRDRALIQTLFETGARISGFLDICRKDVRFDSFGAIVKIRTEKRRNEKNPFRMVRIESSAPALEKWMTQIPDDPEHFVWTDMRNQEKRMTYDAVHFVLKFAGQRAKLGKKIHAHIFRHSSVTYWNAKGLPDGVLKERVGWKPASKQMNRYSHITAQQMDDATLKTLGHENNGNGESIKKKVCPRCYTENEFSNFCSKCSFPLNDKASAELIRQQRLGTEVYRLLLQSQEGEEIIRKVARENPEKIRDIIEK